MSKMILHKQNEVASVDAPLPAPRAAQYQPTFMELIDIGDQLVSTRFLPEHIKTGAQAAAIIMAGRELGMEMMRALRSLVIVKGKVTEYADSQLSRFKADGGRSSFKTLDDDKAVLWLRHPNGDEHTETFTMVDARAAGLTSNGNYNKFKKAMLRSRVITAGLKSIGWEGGAGIYDPSEDIADEYSDPNTEEKKTARLEHIETRRTDPTAPQPIATLAQAEVHVYPGPKNDRNPHGGKALRDVPGGALRKLRTWLHRDTMQDAESGEYDYTTMSMADRQTLLACEMVMEARAKVKADQEAEVAAELERAALVNEMFDTPTTDAP